MDAICETEITIKGEYTQMRRELLIWKIEVRNIS